MEYVGRALWETIDDYGNIIPFQDEVFINESIPYKLLSPQAFLAHHKDGTRTGKIDDHFRIYKDRSEWHLRGKKVLTLGYDQSFFPRITLFSQGKAVPTLKALTGSLDPSNKNLSMLQKAWLRWHIKLGHPGMSLVAKLARSARLDRIALGLFQAKDIDQPKCAACQYGKQTRLPDPTTTVIKNQELMGSLKTGQLIPGSRVFCDQLESRIKGRLFHTAGREPDRDRFCGATIFCDAASGYIHPEFQVTLNASDSITALENFERDALNKGVDVQSYHTDNGIFKSKRFVQEIMKNSQVIRYSGVGAKWQNGAAEGAISIVSSRARTMMIHAALHWPEVEDAALWPLAVQHASYLYNHTPNRESGIAPIEVYSRTLSDDQALRNSHTWGCPTYVLESRLTTAGGKIPKWSPRSRQAQYVGVSPVHAETVGLVRNLDSGYISPQFHVVYDDWFETVYAPAEQAPDQWEHLCTFNRYETHFDEGQAPMLADEWLTPAEQEANHAKKRVQGLRQERRRTWQDSFEKESRDDFSYQAPPQDSPLNAPTREQVEQLPAYAETNPASPITEPLNTSWSRDDTFSPTKSTVSSRRSSDDQPRRSSRISKAPDVLNAKTFKGKSYLPSSLLVTAIAMARGITPQSAVMLQAQLHGYDPSTGLQEWLPPGINQCPMALKAKVTSDPDLPTLKESLTGPNAEHFWTAMDAEINSLESKGTWEIVLRSSLPPGTKVIPGTWVQRIKRLASGELSKFKSRWCCRGDLQDYEGVPYSPLVGWPTVRTGLLMAAAHGWTSRQVDFTLAFCQSPQPANNPLYMELPQYYRPAGHEGKDIVLKMCKSIYGQVDSPKLFFEHLSKGMTQLGFKPSESDPCLFIHQTEKIMVLNYCDDQIWLSPDNKLIEDSVSRLKELGYDLELEKQGDIYSFLGIEFDTVGDSIHLSQKGLIDKVIKYTGMGNADGKDTPASSNPLGSDKDGEPFSEDWNYPAAVGMLLYLSSNTRCDIQFAVHQVCRFSHNPKKSHGQAVKRIIRYLISTPKMGLLFKPQPDEGLDCYVDAGFCGLHGYEDDQDPTSVKSRTGFVLTLFGCPVLWQSKLQTDIALSSTAAEYVAFSMAMRELLPLRVLLQEMSSKMDLPGISNSLVRSTVFEDNMGVLSLVNVPKMSTRNKYLSLKYHFFRSSIGEAKGIVVKYVRSEEQKADIFTKGLPTKQFQVIRKLLMGW